MSGQNIIIRRADITDIEGVASLFDSYREFYGKSSDLKQSIQFLSERISAKESFILVAEIKGKSVGFTQLYPFFSSVQTTRLMVLNDLFVVPEVRRKGVAKKLMDAAVKLANEEGCGGLILETTEDNVQAQSLYKKLGWKEETGVRHYSFDIERL
jgi:ribosomal protein S18 acetylase RimI-like enzyme|tara:strand:+ start:487 stop:951 length:465 start_codon:yes stop_codon:yes gene_type:complete